MGSKFGDIIQKAKQVKSQNSTIEPNDLSNKPDNQITIDLEVNLCVKVPKSLRQHWAAEAKRADITMTSVIVEALTQKFGLPENQK